MLLGMELRCTSDACQIALPSNECQQSNPSSIPALVPRIYQSRAFLADIKERRHKFSRSPKAWRRGGQRVANAHWDGRGVRNKGKRRAVDRGGGGARPGTHGNPKHPK